MRPSERNWRNTALQLTRLLPGRWDAGPPLRPCPHAQAACLGDPVLTETVYPTPAAERSGGSLSYEDSTLLGGSRAAGSTVQGAAEEKLLGSQRPESRKPGEEMEEMLPARSQCRGHHSRQGLYKTLLQHSSELPCP